MKPKHILHRLLAIAMAAVVTAGALPTTALGQEAPTPSPAPVEIASYIAPAAIDTPVGTPWDQLALPTTLEATLADGTETCLPIQWACTPAYDSQVEAVYTLSASFGEGYTLAAGLDAPSAVLRAAPAAVALQNILPPEQEDTQQLEGLFAGKFQAGSQLFDCQRSQISSGPYAGGYCVSSLTVPYSYNERRTQFQAEELADKYFVFRETSRTHTTNGRPIVGLYLYNLDGSPACVSERMGMRTDGLVVEGTITIVADEGILFISNDDSTNGEWGDLGYFISNAAGYSYNYYGSIYLWENAIIEPTLEELKKFDATDIFMGEDEILLRFYPGGENVTGMPNPPYAIKSLGQDFTIAGSFTPSRPGHTFVGWNKRPDGTGVTYLPGAIYKSDVGLKLYAQWVLGEELSPQDPPTGLSVSHAAEHGGYGSLENTTATMQYCVDNDLFIWHRCQEGRTPVPAGTYLVRYDAKDWFAASAAVSVGQVLEPAETPKLSDFTISHISVRGESVGSICQRNPDIVYEYAATPDGPYTPLPSPGGLDGLAAQTLQVRVASQEGVALASAPLAVPIKQPLAPPDAALFTSLPVSTSDAKDGSISGCDPSMEYQPSGGFYWRSISRVTISSLAEGDYEIRYRETPTDLASPAVTIHVGCAPSPDISFVPNTFPLDDAIVGYKPCAYFPKIENTGGTDISGYTITVDSAYFQVEYQSATLAKGDTCQFSLQPAGNLPAGTYTATVAVQTTCGLKRELPVSFTVHPALTLDIAGKTSLQAGESTTLTAQVTGGKAPYTYLWSTGDTGVSISRTPGSTAPYTLIVTDAMGNQVSAGVTVAVTAPPVVPVQPPQPTAPVFQPAAPVPQPVAPAEPAGTIALVPTDEIRDPDLRQELEDLGQGTGTEGPDAAALQAFDYGSGQIVVTVPPHAGIVHAALPDKQHVIEALLSPQDLDLVAQGNLLEIKLDVRRTEEETPAADQQQIEDALAGYAQQTPGLTLGGYLDISLSLRVNRGEWQFVSNAGQPLEVLLNIPDTLLLPGATYHVVRCHNGEVTLLDDLDTDPQTVTIQTQFFSTYALAYQAAAPAGSAACLWHWAVLAIALLAVLCSLLWRETGRKKRQALVVLTTLLLAATAAAGMLAAGCKAGLFIALAGMLATLACNAKYGARHPAP